jgi:glycosyltransferase involved in cell wall biosynthesis
MQLYPLSGGMNEYAKIFRTGYGDNCKVFKVEPRERYWHIFIKLLFNLKSTYLEDIKSFFLDCNQKYIHVTDVPVFAYFVLKYLVKDLGKVVVFTMHDPIPHLQIGLKNRMIRQLQLFLNKRILKLSSRNDNLYVHVHSKELIKSFKVKGNYIFRPHPYSVVNHKVNDLFSIETGKKITFSYVGTINYYKGVDILIQAIAEFNKRNPNVDCMFVIAGKGGEYDKELLEQKNVNVINRFLTDTEFDSIVKYSSWVVLPYREATQSGVLSRAIAHQTPCICNNVGVLSEYVSPNTGVVIDQMDHLKLVKCFEDIIESKPIVYPEPREFDPKVICDDLISIIRK